MYWFIMAPYEAKFRGWRPWDSPKVRPAPGPKWCQRILGAIHRSSNLSAVWQGCHFSGHTEHQRQKNGTQIHHLKPYPKTPPQKKNLAIGRKKLGPLKPSIPSIKVQGFLPLSHLTRTLTSSTERSPPSPLRAQHQRALGPPPDRQVGPWKTLGTFHESSWLVHHGILDPYNNGVWYLIPMNPWVVNIIPPKKKTTSPEIWSLISWMIWLLGWIFLKLQTLHIHTVFATPPVGLHQLRHRCSTRGPPQNECIASAACKLPHLSRKLSWTTWNPLMLSNIYWYYIQWLYNSIIIFTCYSFVPMTLQKPNHFRPRFWHSWGTTTPSKMGRKLGDHLWIKTLRGEAVGSRFRGNWGNGGTIGEWGKLHPGRLTWTIIMEVWKIIFLSFHGWFVGSMLGHPKRKCHLQKPSFQGLGFVSFHGK